MLFVSFLGGCASSPDSAALTMPHPEGCYVEVFDAPNFGGRRNFINGPVKHRTLSDLPGGASWQKRIRSLKVGPAATVLAWAAEDFAGASLRARSEAQHAELSESFSGKIESMQIDCRTAALRLRPSP